MQNPVTAFRRLAVVTAVFAYLQITLGALVRVSGSGLGCPDWPLCHGRPYPPPDIHSIIEYSHRTVGSITGILIIATVVTAWIVFRERDRRVAWVATAALGAVVVEGLLGAFVVFNELPGWLVLVHLGMALAILGLLVATAVVANPGAAPVRNGSFARLTLLSAAATYVLALTGATVVASHADDLCKSWPLCAGGFQFDLAGVNAFNMLHRLFAALVGLFILRVLAEALLRHRSIPGVTPVAALTGAALLVQGLVLGVGVAVTHDNAPFQGLHVAFATAVWTGMVTLAVIAGQSARASRHTAALSLGKSGA